MSALLDTVREGLSEPFADTVSIPAIVVTRAEARAIERALGRPRARLVNVAGANRSIGE